MMAELAAGGRHAFASMRREDVADGVARRGLRPALPGLPPQNGSSTDAGCCACACGGGGGLPAGYAELAAACWAHDPRARPAMGEVAEALRRMLRAARAGGGGDAAAAAVPAPAPAQALASWAPAAAGGDSDCGSASASDGGESLVGVVPGVTANLPVLSLPAVPLPGGAAPPSLSLPPAAANADADADADARAPLSGAASAAADHSAPLRLP